MNEENVWVIDDDRSIRWVLDKAFTQAGMQVTCFETANEALEMVRANAIPPDAIISDIRMPGSDGLTLLKQLKQHQANTPVIIMTAFSDLDNTVSAIEGGAFEYIPKPFDVDDVIEKTRRACQTHKEKRDVVQSNLGAIGSGLSKGHDSNFQGELSASTDIENTYDESSRTPVLLGDSAAMQSVFKAIGRLSQSKTTVLITGESGTGKELIAKALHKHSPRSEHAFITLNIAAIPHELMESELFGHEKGASTGAQSIRVGRFEQADGGTLFLDKIDDMPQALQTRLLHVLATGEFYRVGGHTPVQLDVRIVVSAHQNLKVLVEDQRFREDLYHRLNVIRLEAPPLRDRSDDIPQLMEHFLEQAAVELGEVKKKMPTAFKRHITTLPWPGNVRELENTAHWLTVMTTEQELSISHLPKESATPVDQSEDLWEISFKHWATRLLANGESDLLGKAIPSMERILIQCALLQTDDKKQEAAKLLGWGRNTLTRKIKELGLNPEN